METRRDRRKIFDWSSKKRKSSDHFVLIFVFDAMRCVRLVKKRRQTYWPLTSLNESFVAFLLRHASFSYLNVVLSLVLDSFVFIFSFDQNKRKCPKVTKNNSKSKSFSLFDQGENSTLCFEELISV